uniref:Uncharacterized protein n=1 Tax=Vitrella brassicaformis TaxID=1169539 RepID=A0A7S1K532_9ALVE
MVVPAAKTTMRPMTGPPKRAPIRLTFSPFDSPLTYTPSLGYTPRRPMPAMAAMAPSWVSSPRYQTRPPPVYAPPRYPVSPLVAPAVSRGTSAQHRPSFLSTVARSISAGSSCLRGLVSPRVRPGSPCGSKASG